jgi:sugar fermentation stimulation protein A
MSRLRNEVFAPFPEPLCEARFVRRYQRFLSDFLLPDGRRVTAHCANTGSLRGCLVPGAPALLWDANDPRRKLRYSWKAVQIDGVWVGVDTQLPNRLVELALSQGAIPGLDGYRRIRRERRMGARSRVDLLLDDGEGGGRCYIEVKNVTLVEDGLARFPDAVTTRGRKHLRELGERVAEGHRAAMVYVVQRADGRRFAAAADIDPEYAEALLEAHEAGVEVFAVGCEVTPEGVRATEVLPWISG